MRVPSQHDPLPLHWFGALEDPSGYADEAVMRHGIRDGVPFLQKPFEPDDLVRRVRELVRG